MFSMEGHLWHYSVCHFGASFSAYWWGRTVALLVRILHQLIWSSHAAWNYVDDLLFRMIRSTSPLHAPLTCVFLMLGLGPMSWDKMRVGSTLH